MNIFNELKASLEEAVEIKKGTVEISRATRYDIEEVKAFEFNYKVNQVKFAAALGASVDTIQ